MRSDRDAGWLLLEIVRRAVGRRTAVNPTISANHPAGLSGVRRIAVANSVNDEPHRQSEKKDGSKKEVECVDPGDVEINREDDGDDEIDPQRRAGECGSFELHRYSLYDCHERGHKRAAIWRRVTAKVLTGC